VKHLGVLSGFILQL